MRLAMVSRPLAEADLRLARQMGMTDVVTTVAGVTMAPERAQGPPLRYEDLLALRQRVEAAGLRLSVTEAVFTYPGLGRLLIQAISTRDYPLIQGCILFILVVFVLINLLVDVL